MTELRRILPGLLLALAVALGARVLHGFLPAAVGAAVGEVLLAVLGGIALGHAVRLPETAAPGLRFAYDGVLRAGIVLLGATLSLSQVIRVGGKSLGMVLALMAVALTLAHLLSRAAGIPPRLGSLLAVGTAVCGNSAIVATAPVIGARDDEVSFAVATNTLLGTAAVFLYPLLGHALGLTDGAYGTWAGTAVNDTSQVLAAAFAWTDDAGRLATTVKLTRNALLGLVVLGMGLLYARNGEARQASRRPWIPAFVLGFLALALVNSAGLIGRQASELAREGSKLLVLVALAGVGLSTRISAMRRTGLKPFLVGLATAAVVSGTSLVLIHFLGPAGAP
ncbi:MAG TPA: putative sulfate exporter family transporter [Candidatus Polarisedimenticolaceae bacterium]|nr:putative sulfate exporter family transporter [Candidatus Polarisedimenticolaceae bacterium]